MKKGIFKFVLGFAIVILSLIFICKENKNTLEEKKKITKANIVREVEALETYKVDGNYILNMDESKYFFVEQEGYEYKKAKDYKYISKVTGEERNMKILLPNRYSEDKVYPILFLLHGYEGDESSWIKKRADIMIQNLAYFENKEDKIVVFVNSRLKGKKEIWNEDYVEDVKAFDKTKEEIYRSILPELSRKYKISERKEDRAIAGLSLGGRNALFIGLDENLNFGYVGAFSPEEMVESEKGLPPLIRFEELNVSRKYIEISTGKKDRDTFKGTEKIVKSLKENKIDFNYYKLDGGHETKVWQNSLYNFLKKWK